MRFHGKKGTIDYVVYMIIGMLGLVVILSVLFMGKGSLLHGIKQIIPRTDTFFSRSGSTDPASPDYQANLEKADGAFQELALQYGRLAKDPATSCFITLDHDAMVSIGKTGYTIKLISSTDAGGVAGTNIQLIPNQRSTGEGTAAVSIKENVFIPEVSPCIIYGDTAQAFYDAWLAKSPSGVFSGGSQQAQLTLAKETIIDQSGKSLDWQTEDGDYVLFRSDGMVCFVPTRNGGAKCEERDGLVGKGLVDDDCFRPDDETGLANKLVTPPAASSGAVSGVKGKAMAWDGVKCALT